MQKKDIFVQYAKKTSIEDVFFWVTSGARTHDTRNHNPMLCQLSYSHHIRFHSKASAKVQQKMHMCKFFEEKMYFCMKNGTCAAFSDRSFGGMRSSELHPKS